MKWIKSENAHKAMTIEGYKLIIEILKRKKFSFLIYKDGDLISSSLRENTYSNNINKAKKIAVQRMACHLKKLVV